MIIKTLEYKFAENGTYASISFRQNSGFFQETPQQTRAGILHLAEISAYIPVIDDTKNSMVDELNIRKAIFRVLDTSDHYHEIGSDIEPATFTAVKKIGPTPGVAYGWDIKITRFSTTPSKMSSFSRL
jgi:hypothetical protein